MTKTNACQCIETDKNKYVCGKQCLNAGSTCKQHNDCIPKNNNKNFKNKYLKYKKKYLKLKLQLGKGNCGSHCYKPGDVVEIKNNSELEGKKLKVIKYVLDSSDSTIFCGSDYKKVCVSYFDINFQNRNGNWVYLLKDINGNRLMTTEDKLEISRNQSFERPFILSFLSFLWDLLNQESDRKGREYEEELSKIP